MTREERALLEMDNLGKTFDVYPPEEKKPVSFTVLCTVLEAPPNEYPDQWDEDNEL